MDTIAKRAAQDRLPGVEGGIKELDKLGYEYAATRDRRMETLKEEVELKGKILTAMHKCNMTEYKYEDLSMSIVPGEEKLKVKCEKTPEDDNGE